MFTKMKCVGLFLMCMYAEAYGSVEVQNSTLDTAAESSVYSDTKVTDKRQSLLIEEIGKIVKKHLLQDEMIQLIALLQDLESKITSLVTEDIGAKLKADAMHLYFLGTGKAQSEEAVKLESHLEIILEQMLEKMEMSFITAQDLSKIVRAIVEQSYKNCLKPAREILEIINKHRLCATDVSETMAVHSAKLLAF